MRKGPDGAATVVLSAHALSAGFKRRIEGQVEGGVDYVLVSSLRARGVVGALRALRGMRPDLLLIAFEDSDSAVLTPVLRCIAFVTRARTIHLVEPDLRRSPQSRAGTVRSVVELLAASVAGAIAGCRAYLETGGLNRAFPRSTDTAAGASVLYVNTNLWFGVKAGGSVGHIAGVVNELHRRGVNVRYAGTTEGPQIDRGVERVTLRAHGAHGLPPELNIYRFGRSALRQLREAVRSRPPDIIYQRMSVCDFTGAVLARDLGVPLILEYNGSEVWTARHWGRPLVFERLALASERASLRHADLIVTVSDALRDQLLEAGVPAEKIVVYPNCVDADVFDPARFQQADRTALLSQHGLDECGVVVGFIGTFGMWHGVEVLAAAARRMLDEDLEWVRRHGVGFLIVGDGQRMPAVREALGPHADGPHVRLTGLVPQHEAPRYLAASDILASPHVRNPDGTAFFGSPTKLFEYMAMGRAIVASDLDQIGTVLKDSLRADRLPSEAPKGDESALAVLVEPGSVDELIEGIRFCVEREAWRTRLGYNARREVLGRYLWEHHVDAILGGLDDRIPGTRATPATVAMPT